MTLTQLHPDTDPGKAPAGVLARAEQVVVDRRRILVEDLQLCLAWADLHATSPKGPGVTAPGGDRLVRLGGDGTPRVADLCLEELSIARRVHVANTRATTADALDLRHRLPRLWDATRALVCEPWLARKIARMSRRLTPDQAADVDAAVVPALSQAPSRVLAIAEAAIIAADTTAHEQQLADLARSHGVWLGRLTAADPDDPDSGRGTQTLYARLTPEDGVWLDRAVTELADLLEADETLRGQHAPALAALASPEQEPTRDQYRAAALGLLGKPDLAAQLLGLADAGSTAAGKPRRATVYVHLHPSALQATGTTDHDDAAEPTSDAVARVEGLGPVLASRLRNLLAHADVTLRPVIDLNTGASVNGYEHPASMRERVVLRNTGDVFPHAASLTRNLDLDHVTPYQPGGPPGQTADVNTAPLTRRSHRAKTHAGYRLEQLGPAAYLWTTPHGLNRLVDHTGTHRIDHLEVRLLRFLHPPAA